MTEHEKKAEIKKLQLELDRRLCFFAILTDIKGSNTGKKLVPETHNSKLITLNS